MASLYQVKLSYGDVEYPQGRESPFRYQEIAINLGEIPIGRVYIHRVVLDGVGIWGRRIDIIEKYRGNRYGTRTKELVNEYIAKTFPGDRIMFDTSSSFRQYRKRIQHKVIGKSGQYGVLFKP